MKLGVDRIFDHVENVASGGLRGNAQFLAQEHSAALREALRSYQNAARLGQLAPSLEAFVTRRSAALKRVLN